LPREPAPAWRGCLYAPFPKILQTPLSGLKSPFIPPVAATKLPALRPFGIIFISIYNLINLRL
jgi:hypothetical protein